MDSNTFGHEFLNEQINSRDKRDFALAEFGTTYRLKQPKQAWIATPPKQLQPSQSNKLNNTVLLSLPTDSEDYHQAQLMNINSIVEIIASVALPEEASNCPRALEFLNELRNFFSVSKYHEPLLVQLAQQLEDNVADFLVKKDVEIEQLLSTELRDWQSYVDNEHLTVSKFIEMTTKDKVSKQLSLENGSKYREARFLSLLNETEKSYSQRKLLAYNKFFSNFRQVSSQNIDTSLLNSDKRLLESSFSVAQSKIDFKTQSDQRELMR